MTYKNKEQQKQYQREWVANRRQEWINENGPCKCGSWDQLDVDHIYPKDKIVSISQGIWSLSKTNPKRILELEKCQVLCVPCHTEKTRLEKLSDCGTGTSYQRGCRCIQCKAWKSAALKRETRRQKK